MNTTAPYQWLEPKPYKKFTKQLGIKGRNMLVWHLVAGIVVRGKTPEFMAEDYRLPAVDGKKRIKLVGVANKLYLASVTGGAEVDATELDTRWVHVGGRIDDGAKLRLVAQGGLVNFAEGIGGGATVTVDAASGTVSFAKPPGPKAKGVDRPVIGGGAGTGISAKCEEAGGIDLIVIYNSGRFRMAGRGSMAGLMPYGNANAIVKEMAYEVLTAVRHTPVLA